jgi:hypothetical protein
LGAHLANAEHNEEVRPGESRGLTAEGIRAQIDELTRLGSHAKTSTPIYHVHADPPAGRPWSQDERARYWELFEREFGLEGRPFASVIHVKEGREHEHRAYLRVRPDGRAIRLDHDHARREKISRVMEWERGEPLTKGAHNRAVMAALRHERPEIAQAMETKGLHQGPKPVAPLTPQNLKQQDRTGIKKADVAKATATAWASSDGPQAFQAALRDAGLILAQGDTTPVIVDRSGSVHGLQKMLAMSARSQGEPSPKKADIQAWLRGAELPSLDEARAQAVQVQPVEVAQPVPEQVAQPVQPDPVPPGPGGEPVPVIEVPSQDVNTAPVAMATPSNDGQQIPAAASAKGTSPKGLGGGGGGSSSAAEQSSPLPSLDVGKGPGEPPGPGAHPDEIAKYHAGVADYEDRKTKAWQAWLRAWDAQNKPKSKGTTAGGGSDVHDEKELRRVASDLIREIESRAEQGAAIRAFNQAFEQFNAFRSDEARRRTEEQSRGISAPERSQGGPGDGYPRRDEPAPRNGGAEPDAGTHRRDGHDDGGVGTDREKSERNPLLHRAESLAIGRLAALSDFSRLRVALSGLSPSQDPLEGLGPKERKARLQEFREELLSLYRQDRGVMREHGQADWRERMAAEKVRASPLAEQLRKGWKHLTPEQREQGWRAIREARESLVEQMKATAKANPPQDFRAWLEFVSKADPKASCVLDEIKRVEADKAKITHELAQGDERLETLKATAPKGERDEDKAASEVKSRMKEEHAQREAAAREAREKASKAGTALKWWHWKSHPVRAAARAANEHAETIEHAMRIHAPSQTDFREAQETARSRARSNLRAFQAWEQSPKGMEAAGLERSLQGIRNALAGRDFYMRDAILTGGIDGALEEQRRREALEQKRREIELRKAERKQDLETGKVVQFPGSAGPRMR